MTSKVTPLTIGVLALQGDFLEHEQVLLKLGVLVKQVRLPPDLNNLDGLIIPGGESTTMARLIDVFDLRQPIIEKIKSGLPVWGTCAGLILLAKKLDTDVPLPLRVLNVSVSRNAFGRQIDSFETNIKLTIIKQPITAVFIRAPIINSVGKGVKILGRLPNKSIIAIQEKNILGTAFHPELTSEFALHQYFVNIALNHKLRLRKRTS